MERQNPADPWTRPAKCCVPDCLLVQLFSFIGSFIHSFTCAQAIAEVCALCNEAQLECKAGVFRAVGAPTEAALVCMVEKLGLPDQAEHSQCFSLRKQASIEIKVLLEKK